MADIPASPDFQAFYKYFLDIEGGNPPLPPPAGDEEQSYGTAKLQEPETDNNGWELPEVQDPDIIINEADSGADAAPEVQNN
jgi:hypothetical protein